MKMAEQNIEFLLSEIVDDGFMLPECGKVSQRLLSTFRISDEFKTMYGNYILDYYPTGAGVLDAMEALKKYKHLEIVDIVEHRDTIIDFIYSKSVLGFAAWEYFAYGLEGKSTEEKLKFMKNTNIFRYYKALNTDARDAKTLGNKYNTYMRFMPFFKREMIRIKDKSDKELLRSFCSRHDTFMIKPVGSAMGRGIRLIHTADYADFDELCDNLFQDKSFICEELITPHESFVQINPGCVNTVRIFTYFNGMDTNIVCAWMKAGRANAVVDNAGAGGMLAAIDETTGIVITGAADEQGGVYPVHPETGFVFKGFQIPQWDEAINIVKTMASHLPGVAMIGWDLALSADKGWQVIEGNEGGQVNLIQIPHKKGMLNELTERFEWKKNRRHLRR